MPGFFPPLFFQAMLALLLGLAGLAMPLRAAISLGIDELEKSNFAVLQGKRVGLVTNPSGVDSHGRSAISVLRAGRGYQLVKLFGPEHGIDGLTGAGNRVANSRDRATGLPVFSLFGDTRVPTPAMLQGLDVLVYDVQDLGNRSYTFISTLGNVMQEAARFNIEVVVLDRPNPLGGIRIEGPRLDPGLKSFVGMFNVPFIYGLTPGELAQWINAKYLPAPCRLTVIPMKGWIRSMVWEDTGLHWVPTSPNIPTIGAARGYTATGFLGEIGIESGIGSPVPFQAIAGRGWDAADLTRRLNALHIPGVHASVYHYRAGSDYSGSYLAIDPRNAGNLTAISFQAIEILQHSVSHFSAFGRTKADQRQMFDKVSGTSTIRRDLIAGRPVSAIVRSWDAGITRWAEERIPYLLYGNSTKQLPLPRVAEGAEAPSGPIEETRAMAAPGAP